MPDGMHCPCYTHSMLSLVPGILRRRRRTRRVVNCGEAGRGLQLLPQRLSQVLELLRGKGGGGGASEVSHKPGRYGAAPGADQVQADSHAQ